VVLAATKRVMNEVEIYIMYREEKRPKECFEILKNGLNGCEEKTLSWMVNTTKEMP
jgi:hypothetical protein